MSRVPLHDHHDFNNGGPIRSAPSVAAAIQTIVAGNPAVPGDCDCPPLPVFVPSVVLYPTTTVTIAFGLHVTVNSPGNPGKLVRFKLSLSDQFSDAALITTPGPAPYTDWAGSWTADSTAGDGTGLNMSSGGRWGPVNVPIETPVYVIAYYDPSSGAGTMYTDGGTTASLVSPSGTQSITVTSVSANSGGLGASFVIGQVVVHDSSLTVPPSSAPQLGQWIVEYTTGDGTDLSASPTNYPYAPRSLFVFVDGQLESLTETDPTAGTYALDNAARSGSLITYLYQTGGGVASGTHDTSRPVATGSLAGLVSGRSFAVFIS